jgi:hypothetical protein
MKNENFSSGFFAAHLRPSGDCPEFTRDGIKSGEPL